MEQYVDEYNKILFLIEEVNKKIVSLRHDIEVNNRRINIINNKIDGAIYDIKEEIKYLENEKKILEISIKNKDDYKKRINRYIVVIIIGITFLISSFFFGFIKFITAIVSTFNIFFTVDLCYNLYNFFKLKNKISKYDLDDIEAQIVDKNKQLNNILCKINPLILEKHLLETRNNAKYDEIRCKHDEIKCLKNCKNEISDLLSHLMNVESFDCCNEKMDNYITKSLVKRNVDNM